MQTPAAAPARAPEMYTGPAPTDRTGPSLFKAYCAQCHGAAGAGDGPVASRLPAGVRDLRSGMRHFSGAGGRGVTVADVLWVMERGVPGTAMASFSGLFNKTEALAVARQTVTLVKGDPAAAPLDLGPAAELSADTVMEGASVYARAGCAQCHGLDGTGGPAGPLAALKNDDGTAARWPRLDRPVVWRGGPGARDIALRVANGVPGTPMAAYRPALKDREIWALATYVETMARMKTVTPLALLALDVPPPEDLTNTGLHLLETMNCVGCHRTDAAGNVVPTRVDVGALGSFVASALLPALSDEKRAEPGSPEMRALVREQLVRALKDGVGVDGRRLHPLAMPWPLYASLTEAQLSALAAALAVTGPRGKVEPGRNASWVTQVVGKLSAVAGLVVLEKQIGAPQEEGEQGPEPWMVAASALGATAGVVLFLLFMAVGGSKRARRKRTIIAMMPIPVGAVLTAVLAWPAYDFRPAFSIRSAMGSELPQPSGLGEDAQRLAGWGQDLVAAAGCTTCHTAQDPFRLSSATALAGGVRVRGAAFGRVHAGNLTPHETGLGAYTPEELRRVFRAGVGRDGRVFHPDAMPFPRTAAWTDEETEAVITYLRAIPPVPGPRPQAGGGDDFPGVALGLFRWE